MKEGIIFRWDNAPNYPQVATFPKHVHKRKNKNVKESHLSDDPEHALMDILEFIQRKLKKKDSERREKK